MKEKIKDKKENLIAENEIPKRRNLKENPMQRIKIEKIVLSVGAKGEDLERGVRLLKLLSGGKPAKMQSKKRIPALSVRPGLEIGAVVTIRRGIKDVLRKMLAAEDNKIRRKQVSENGFSFGIKEYLEIPGLEYQRDIGIAGLDVTVVFKRAGRRVQFRKIKRGKIPKRQRVTKEEIIKFMEDNFGVEFKGK